MATVPDTSTLLTWTDAYCVAPNPAFITRCGGAAQSPPLLQSHARLGPVVFQSSLFATAEADERLRQGREPAQSGFTST